MTIVWPLQEAKNKLGEVIDRAAKAGPQTVTPHGKRVAVIVSAREFDRLSGASLWDYLRAAPAKGMRLRLERDRSPGRLVKL